MEPCHPVPQTRPGLTHCTPVPTSPSDGIPAHRAAALIPRSFHAAAAAGIPLRAIFEIAEESKDGEVSDRALDIAGSCLGGWLRHAHLAELELPPSAKEFADVEARRRHVFHEVATVLAIVEAFQRRAGPL